MSLSRKRKKELKQLKKQANKLWNSQQELLNKASDVAQEARAQLGNYSREQLVPAMVNTYESRIQPKVDSGARALSTARRRIERGVSPYIDSVVNDRRVQNAVSRVTKAAPVPTKKSGPSAGAVIAIGVGVVAAAGVAYAVWQTFRADDELWVADDDSLFPNS
ncbi:MAG: DNA helicase [Mycetocola sp.]